MRGQQYHGADSSICVLVVSGPSSGVGVAQSVERWIVVPVVVGSSPIAHPPSLRPLHRQAAAPSGRCTVKIVMGASRPQFIRAWHRAEDILGV